MMLTPIASPQAVLENQFGYSAFREGQQSIIDAILRGKHCFVLMATGGGKSLCYQVPALCVEGVALVISPLIALMKDQVAQLKANGIEAEYLSSEQSFEEQNAILTKLQTNQLKLLYASPEKIEAGLAYTLRQVKLSFIVIDESHCISQWGHDFRPEYATMGKFLRSLNVPLMALTATADKLTRHDILHALQFEEGDYFSYIGSFDRPNIRYTVVESAKDREKKILDFIKKQRGQSGIIYCGSRKKVEELSLKLREKGLSVRPFHAKLTPAEKNQTQDAFLRDDIQIIVATVAFGMGINKPNVRFVIHYDPPRSIESYYQETGRAGRDGLPSEALMFYSASYMAFLEKAMNEESTQVSDSVAQVRLHKLHSLMQFAQAQTCRRETLLNYFGQATEQHACGNCDICLNPPAQYNATLDLQKIASTIFRLYQHSQHYFGASHLIDVLRGAQTKALLEQGHDRLSTYGIGRDHPSSYWQNVITQLIHLGYLEQHLQPLPVLTFTEKTRPFLAKNTDLVLELALPRDALKITVSRHHSAPDPAQHDKDLYARLVFLRKQIADQQNLAPYIVFGDATLKELARFKPKNADEMLAISGIGVKKLERFGAPFLDLINQYR